MMDANEPEISPISPDEALTILRDGDIDTEYGMLRWSSNYAFLLGVKKEMREVTAVYKPQRGERPLWDFPDGTLCNREYAAYLTSQQLGWQIVPPTVLREGSHGLGTIQFFIEHDPQVNYFSFDETLKPQLERIALFDVLVNNADRKGGHCLLDPQDHIWGIDHGITFNAQHKLRTVIWDFADEPISETLMRDIERLSCDLEDETNAYRLEMRKLLTRGEMNAFAARVRVTLKNGKYPVPGAGPNYPWPPV